jgi:hypothetical protein
MADEPLEKRFHKFLDQLDHSENLDRMTLAGKKADYLLHRRKLIAEIKTIESDPAFKVEELIDALRPDPNFPVFFGQRDIEQVLAHFPNAQQIRQRLFDVVTRQIERALKSADDQIAATRAALDLPSACGVVYILNDRVPLLDPNQVATAVSRFFVKRRESALRYQEIAFVCFLSEAHIMLKGPSEESLPIVEVEGPRAVDFPGCRQLVSALSQEWANHEGVAFFSMEASHTRQFDYQDRDRVAPVSKNPMTRSDYWRLQYRKNRYLASLSEDAFWEHTARILKAMTRHFLVGGRKLPESAVMEFMEGWGHCLEEAELRNLDMRRLYEFFDPTNCG